MKKAFTQLITLSWLFASFTLSAFTFAEVDKADIDPKLNQLASRAVLQTDFKPTKKDRFAWFQDIQVLKDENVNVRKEGLPLVKKSLTQALAEHHYTFTDDLSAADFYALAIVLIGNDVHKHEIGDKFGLVIPDDNDGPDYQRGTLTLFFFSKDKEIVWSGAAQIFNAPELPEKFAETRIKKALDTLLVDLPEVSE